MHFKTSIGGVRREYDARITTQEPDQRVSWESLDEPRNAGTVWFEDLGDAETKVNVELTWEPDSAAEKIGAAIGLDSRQVAADLKKFKQFIEERGAETGGWRGRVDRSRRAPPPPCRSRRKWATARNLPSSAWTPIPTLPPSRLSARTSSADRAFALIWLRLFAPSGRTAKRPASLSGDGAFCVATCRALPELLPGCGGDYLVSVASTSLNFAEGRMTAATLAASGR